MKHRVGNARRAMKRYWFPLAGIFVLSVIVAATVVIVYVPGRTAQAASGDWSTFLGSNARTGFNAAETVINPTTAPKLKLKWTAQTSGHVSNEPLLVNGVVYWGAWDGTFHATNVTTGKDLWVKNLGQKPGSCGQNYGFVGTATVASVLVNGISTQLAFVAGGQDNVTALDTSTGNTIWQTNLGNTKGEFIYASTSVYNGSVYIGISSFGDCPLVQGQVVQLNASTGAIQHTFNVVPKGCVGGAVWGSLTIDEATGMLYFGTGNGNPTGCLHTEPLASALVELRASDLSLVSSWQLTTDPALDYDIGSTPDLFNATIKGVAHAMVGFVSKDGVYYAFDRANIGVGPLWKATISIGGSGPETGNGSISAGAYDGTHLYQAGGQTTIAGQKCMGSLRALDPNTGKFIWQKCLGSPVLDPVIAVPGLVVVGWGNTMYVVNSANGTTLFAFQDKSNNAKFWGAATISNGVLLDGSRSGKLYAFGL
jgi:outer membrane protein assembly factor BamB